MKLSTTILTGVLILCTFIGCNKKCDDILRIGEVVQIPVSFVGFSLSEIENILVYRIDKNIPNSTDTFLLKEILLANMARSSNEIITDTQPSSATESFGYYESYLNNCDLIFDWQTGKDTLFNFEIIKSKETVKGCHQNDPNIRIDKLSFVHKANHFKK